MGEIEAGGQSRFQHRLPRAHADGAAVRLYADVVVVGCQGNGTCVRVKIVPTRDYAKANFGVYQPIQ
jgi:hypothetical protein